MYVSLYNSVRYAVYNLDLNGLFNYPTAIFANHDVNYD